MSMFITVPEGEKFVTYRTGADGAKSGPALGMWPAADQAAAQIKSFEERATAARQKFMRFEQSAVNYTPVSPSQDVGMACSGCIFYDEGYSYSPSCRLVQDWPAPIVPNGLCDRFEASPNPKPAPMEVIIVEGAAAGTPPAPAPSNDPGVLRRGIDALTGMMTKLLAPPEPMIAAFKVYTAADGSDRWIAQWSNNYKDLEDEIFPYHAQDAYIERVKAGISPMPVLMRYHIPGSVHGKANWVGRVGNFMMATGTFTDDPLGEAFKAFYKKAGPQEMSHGFWYPTNMKVDGVYHYFDTFELTTLPVGSGANPFTYFDGGKSMEISQKQKDDFIAAVGADLAGPIINNLATFSKAIDGAGIESKMNTPAPAAPAAAAPAGVPVIQDVEARKQLGALSAAQPAMELASVKMMEAVTAIATGQKGFNILLDTRVKAVEAGLAQINAYLGNSSPASGALGTRMSAAEAAAAGGAINAQPPGAPAPVAPAAPTMPAYPGAQFMQNQGAWQPPGYVQPAVIPQMAPQQQVMTEQGQFDMGIFNDLFGNMGQPQQPATPFGAVPPLPGAPAPVAAPVPAAAGGWSPL